MKFYTLLKRGTAHSEFCEDFLFTTDINDTFFVGCIFDGCSGGDASHFASTLFAKVFREVCANIIIPEVEFTKENLIKKILFESFDKIKNMKKNLGFNTNDLLTTIIATVYEYNTNSAIIITAGDGFISINGNDIEIDQKNTPEYPAYFFDDINRLADFEKWYEQKTHKIAVKKVNDITISSDGILTYKKESSKEIEHEKNPIEFLTKDTFLSKNILMLYRKYNILKNKSAMTHADDISLIRIISNI